MTVMKFQYSTELDEKIACGEELPSGERESEIRAGAIVACEEIVAASGGRLTNLELDWYLWRVGASLVIASICWFQKNSPFVAALFRQGAPVPWH